MNKQPLILIGGIPGAGKTTFGLKLQQKTGLPFNDIDKLFPQLNGEEKWEAFIQQYKESVLARRGGIYSGSMRLPETRKDLVEYAIKNNFAPTGIFFNYDPSVVIGRARTRSISEHNQHPIPYEKAEVTIKEWYKKFTVQDNTDLENGWLVVNDPRIDDEKLAEEVVKKLGPFQAGIEGQQTTRLELSRK